mmetsp:Transcript_124044/g.247031  ORF Transcript_124044/g.247031 Transcript_124044/m.247031 type:complete len:239 (+) Transcript_124044:1068-1784(+)
MRPRHTGVADSARTLAAAGLGLASTCCVEAFSDSLTSASTLALTSALASALASLTSTLASALASAFASASSNDAFNSSTLLTSAGPKGHDNPEVSHMPDAPASKLLLVASLSMPITELFVDAPAAFKGPSKQACDGSCICRALHGDSRRRRLPEASGGDPGTNVSVGSAGTRGSATVGDDAAATAGLSEASTALPLRLRETASRGESRPIRGNDRDNVAASLPPTSRSELAPGEPQVL